MLMFIVERELFLLQLESKYVREKFLMLIFSKQYLH
jgi:hypothetical protein